MLDLHRIEFDHNILAEFRNAFAACQGIRDPSSLMAAATNRMAPIPELHERTSDCSEFLDMLHSTDAGLSMWTFQYTFRHRGDGPDNEQSFFLIRDRNSTLRATSVVNAGEPWTLRWLPTRHPYPTLRFSCQITWPSRKEAFLSPEMVAYLESLLPGDMSQPRLRRSDRCFDFSFAFTGQYFAMYTNFHVPEEDFSKYVGIAKHIHKVAMDSMQYMRLPPPT